jgi:hypothetical protein
VQICPRTMLVIAIACLIALLCMCVA